MGTLVVEVQFRSASAMRRLSTSPMIGSFDSMILEIFQEGVAGRRTSPNRSISVLPISSNGSVKPRFRAILRLTPMRRHARSLK